MDEILVVAVLPLPDILIHNNNDYIINGRIHFNLSSAAGLIALNPAANGRYLINMHIITLLFTCYCTQVHSIILL